MNVLPMPFLFVLCVALATTAFAAPTNVAPLGSARQSSTAYDGPQYRGSGPASRAIDGNTNGQYYGGSVSCTASEQAWWEVALDKVYVLQEVVVWNRSEYSARINPFTVHVYLGNRLVHSLKQNVMPASNTLKLSVAGVVGDRVRVALEKPNWLQLAEVQVFAEPQRELAGEYAYLGNGVATVEQNGLDVRMLLTWTPDPNGPHYEVKGTLTGDRIIGEWYSRHAKKGWFRFIGNVAPNGDIEFSQSADPINAGFGKAVLLKVK